MEQIDTYEETDTMPDAHLKFSNLIEEIAERLPNSRFGRQYRNGIEEEADYPYSGEMMTRMTEVLRDIATGSDPDMDTLEKEVDAFVSTQVSISQALDALIEALINDGRMKKADQVRRLRYFHDVMFG